MPTEKRTNETDTWISCDDGIHLILMDESNDHYGWVFRKVNGSWPYSVRKATEHEMAHAKARQHLRAGVSQLAAESQPAPQLQAETGSYPPCDYCGTVPAYHPWHGSGVINGTENRHIHACDGCRGKLPAHPGQHRAEPIAWMVGTAIWWTKEEAERDAAATGLPIVGLGQMTASIPAEQSQGIPVGEVVAFGKGLHEIAWAAGRMPKLGAKLYTSADPGEVERLRAALKFYADREHYHFESGNWDTVSGEPLNILWCGDEPDFIEDGSVARAALEHQP
ncbi:hypothetical protein ACJ70E_16080 [Pseudomonas plecoglossicida]|uniref:hypothetical protein n=1 Tax=Pseudomonas plecoglossicida TaxID=70775 RepID=UPI0039775541